MEKKLYFIANAGCDDTTFGITELTEEEFQKFKKIIEELNKNSTYGCMPTIYIYQIDWSQLEEITEVNPEDENHILYYNSKRYIFKNVNDYYQYTEFFNIL